MFSNRTLIALQNYIGIGIITPTMNEIIYIIIYSNEIGINTLIINEMILVL